MIIYCSVGMDGELQELDYDQVAAEMPYVAQSAHGVCSVLGAKVPCLKFQGQDVVLGWAPGDGSLEFVPLLPPAPRLTGFGADNKSARRVHGTLVHVDEYQSWLAERRQLLEGRDANAS